MKRAFVTLLSLTLLPASAWAGVIGPGDSQILSSGEFAGPTGSLLAEKTIPFAIDYGADPDIGFDGKLNGTLHSAVYNVGGKLTFFYDVNFDPANFVDGAIERSDLLANAFTGFTTEISGMLEHEEVIAATRSADGSQISLFSDSPGLGGAPALLVETDAMAYDDNGTINYFAADEIGTPAGPGTASGGAMIQGAYQPISGNGLPTAIPLPPAVYSGLGVMMAMGMVLALRRWHEGRLPA